MQVDSAAGALVMLSAESQFGLVAAGSPRPMAASRPDRDRFRRLYVLTESYPRDQNYSHAHTAGN